MIRESSGFQLCFSSFASRRKSLFYDRIRISDRKYAASKRKLWKTKELHIHLSNCIRKYLSTVLSASAFTKPRFGFLIE